MKICFKCNVEKELSEFYKHKKMGDGHLSKCIVCTKKDVADHREKNIEKIREYDRNRANLPHRKKLNIETTKQLRTNFPLKYKAHSAVNYALKNGNLSKPDICETCKKNGRQIEGHHNDYSKPLEVVWLCSACHKQLHRDLKKISI